MAYSSGAASTGPPSDATCSELSCGAVTNGPPGAGEAAMPSEAHSAASGSVHTPPGSLPPLVRQYAGRRHDGPVSRLQGAPSAAGPLQKPLMQKPPALQRDE